MILFFCLTVLLSVMSFAEQESHLLFGSNSVSIGFQKLMLSLGHEHRFIAGLLFTAIFLGLYVNWIRGLNKPPRFSQKYIIPSTLILLGVTFLAYPASFSHDIFEYIFWTKIPVVYHENPWFVPGSHFAADPWSHNLHWPDETYKYGPLWLILTVLVYPLGRSDLLTLLYVFKGVMVLFSLGIVGILIRLAHRSSLDPIRAVSSFLLNPIVLIELFITPHNDIVMTFFFLAGLYFFMTEKRLSAWTFIGFSILTKYATAMFVPVFLLFRKVSVGQLLLTVHMGSLCMAFVMALYRSINGWYFILFFAVSSLLIRIPVVRYLYISVSAGLLLRYLPYIYLGYFDPSIKIRLVLFLLAQLPFITWYFPRLIKQPAPENLSAILDWVYLIS